jgi:hypothetical protein
MKKFGVIILLVILTSLSAKSKKKPEWINNPNAKYPDTMYLTSIGKGDSRFSAENNAAGNLARIFESKVKVDEKIVQRYSELSSNTKSDVSEEMSSNKSVSITSGQTLLNVKFGESFTDEMGQVFTIAYIDRMRTADIYEQKIQGNSEQIEYFLKKSEGTDDKLQKYAALSAAEIFAETNQTLIDQLRIISSTMAEFVKPKYSLSQIKNNKMKTASALFFAINIKNDDEGYIENLFNEILINEGFTTGKDTIISVTGDIKFNDVTLDRPEKFVQYQANISVKNGNQEIAFLRLKGREGSSSKERAKEIAYRSIQKKINRQFSKKFHHYIDQLAN